MNSMSRDGETDEEMLTDADVVVAEEWVKLLDRLAAVMKERDEARRQLEKVEIDKQRMDWLDQHYLLCDQTFRFCDRSWLPRHAIDHQMELS